MEPDNAIVDGRVCPPEEPPAHPRNGLSDLVLRTVLPVGGPVSGTSIIGLNLDGDPEGALELIVTRGGRVEVFGAAGDDWWRTPVVDARSIKGAPDLDGDGRREVVVTTGSDVLVLDGLTGQVNWQLPESPLGPDTVLSEVQNVRIADFDGDGLVDLYVTDSGCGDEGTGRGVVFGFADGRGRPLGRIAGPRANGRCTRWQTARDLDGDHQLELMVTDANGLNVFDPLTGARLACGDLGDAFSNGVLPTLPMGPGLPGWFLFLPSGVARADMGPDRNDQCPEAQAITMGWLTPSSAVALGSFVRDTDNDGEPDLITSRWSDDDAVWQVVRFDGGDGRIDVLLSDGRLLGPVDFEGDGTPSILVRVGDPAVPPRFGALQIFHLDGEPLWNAPISASNPIRGRQYTVSHTPEFSPLLHLPTNEGARLVILSGESADDTLVRQLGIVGPGGVSAVRALDGEPGFVGRVCTAPPECHPSTPLDRLILARADGRIGVLDASLLLRNSDPRQPDSPGPLRPVGASEVVVVADVARDRLAVFSAAGVLSVLDPNHPDQNPVWQTVLGRPRRGTPGLRALQGDGQGGVLVRDARAGDAAWSVFEVADGRLRWRHQLDPTAHVVMRPMVSARTLGREWVARMDRPVTGRPLLPDPSCPEDLLVEPDPFAPDPRCPEIEILFRVVTALDATDGHCRWRRVLRPAYPCSGPANQALSVADGDGDGQAEIYVTETNGLHRLDPETGASTGFAHLGFGATGALRGGGWVRGTSAPSTIVRTGGNGPIEAFDADLGSVWVAPNPPGLRLQSWIGRDALALGDGVWTVPGQRWPLHRYHLEDGRVDRRVGLVDGRVQDDAPAEAEFSNIESFTAISDVDGQGNDGFLVTADDGVVYALDTQGREVWTRAHDTTIGSPLVHQLDGVGLREMVVPAGDGRILVYGEPGPAPPPTVWDLPCPAVTTCDPGTDIDESTDTTRFCGEWTSLVGVDGYEARVLGPNGAVIRDWIAVDEASVTFNGLRLVPGIRYALEVRALKMAAGRPTRSTGTLSDGVLIIDNGAPRVQVDVDPDALVPGTVPTEIMVRATDDDRLAGWHLDIIDAASGGLVVRLASAALNHPVFEDRFFWDTTNRDKRPLEPGEYRVRAEFTDRAGNTGAGEALLTLCDGVCP